MDYKWKIVLVAISGTFMMMIDATIVNIALPHMLAVFNDTIDKMQFITSAYLMAMAVAAPLATYLMNKFGVKRIYVGSLVLFLAGSMLCGISWNTNSLIVFRILQGLSSGVLMPLAMTLIFTNVPPEGRGTAMGIFGIPMVLAPAIGVTLGGYLVEYIDWRWCFYVNIPVVIVAVIISVIWIKDTPKNAALPLDVKGFVSAALGFGTLLYALTYAPSWGWSDIRTLGLMGISLASLIFWIVVEFRVKVPLLDLRVFKFRGYSLGTFLSFVTTMGLYSAMLLLPLFLQSVRGLGAFQAGILMIPQAVGSMFGTIIGGRFYDKMGPRPPTIIGLLLTGYITWQLSALDVTTPNSTFMWLIAFRGLGIGLCMMPVMTFSLAEVPMELTSAASTLNNVLRAVFGGLATAVFASLLSSYEKFNLAVLIQTVTPDSGSTLRMMSTAQVYLQQAGMSAQAAHQQAVALLYQMTVLRAYVLAFDKVFIIGAVIIFIGIIPALFLYHNGKEKKKKPEVMPME
jgi:EmrB/QacA subfamily drug resistance transporter